MEFPAGMPYLRVSPQTAGLGVEMALRGLLAEDRLVRLRPSGARRWLRKWRARLVRKRRLRNSGKKQVPHPRLARVRNDKVFACGKVFGLIRRSNGTKSPSLWFSARLYQAVEVALVRRARLRQAAARRRQAEE